MSESCGNKKPENAVASSCCAPLKGKTILLYACSGAANVAEIADKAARQLMLDGCGAMFCLAALGADIPEMVQTARDADLNFLIDGCPTNCAKETFDRHGLTNYRHIKVTDLGIEKAKDVPVTRKQVQEVVDKAKETLGERK